MIDGYFVKIFAQFTGPMIRLRTRRREARRPEQATELKKPARHLPRRCDLSQNKIDKSIKHDGGDQFTTHGITPSLDRQNDFGQNY
jgi:hypothetical protein